MTRFGLLGALIALRLYLLASEPGEDSATETTRLEVIAYLEKAIATLRQL